MSLKNFVNLLACGSVFMFAGLCNIDATGQVVETPSTLQTKDNTERVWQQTSELYSTLAGNSLRPVTKQQFMLEVARAFFSVQSKEPPGNLHEEVSGLATDSELKNWLTEVWDQAGLADWKTEGEESLRDLICQTVVEQIVPRAGFITAKQQRVQKQLAENQYVGIGITVRWHDGKTTILNTFPGGAARQAGLRPGDCILEIDGQSMAGFNLGQAVDKARGPEGSQVNVVVQNLDGSEPRTVDMVRTIVPSPSVAGVRQRDDGAWLFVEDKDARHAFLKIDKVVGSTARELRGAAGEVVDQGLQRIVLDMQSLTDGDLHQLHLMADVLCEEGKFGSLKFPAGPTQELMTRADSAFSGMQIVVLSPLKPVSGPVLALLAMLKTRPGTQIVGPTIENTMTCRASFDLSNHSGTVTHLPYAWLVPALLNLQPAVGKSPTLHFRIQFTPHVVAEDPQKIKQLAMEWLHQN